MTQNAVSKWNLIPVKKIDVYKLQPKSNITIHMIVTFVLESDASN